VITTRRSAGAVVTSFVATAIIASAITSFVAATVVIAVVAPFVAAAIVIAAVTPLVAAAVMAAGSATVAASKATSADVCGGNDCDCQYGRSADQQILDHGSISFKAFKN
jgi:hypothetical protein